MTWQGSPSLDLYPLLRRTSPNASFPQLKPRAARCVNLVAVKQAGLAQSILGSDLIHVLTKRTSTRPFRTTSACSRPCSIERACWEASSARDRQSQRHQVMPLVCAEAVTNSRHSSRYAQSRPSARRTAAPTRFIRQLLTITARSCEPCGPRRPDLTPPVPFPSHPSQ